MKRGSRKEKIVTGKEHVRKRRSPSFDQNLAEKIRHEMMKRRGVDERVMFGGAAFFIHGKMACGVIKDNLVVRVGSKAYETVLKKPHVKPMDVTGRPLMGFVYVRPEGYQTDRQLSEWIDKAVEFVGALPGQKISDQGSGKKKKG